MTRGNTTGILAIVHCERQALKVQLDASSQRGVLTALTTCYHWVLLQEVLVALDANQMSLTVTCVQ